MKRASYYETDGGFGVKCLLCPHNCRMERDKTGFCGARKEHGGELVAENYGRITSFSLDPVEKKPLYHFYPGSMILSIGSYGCNFRCPFCQNHEISMGEPEWRYMPPEDVAEASAGLSERGNIGVAYTYNEPLISYEFVRDCAELVHSNRQKNVLVTNGFICEEPLRELLPLIDAMNIDLKSFSPEFYKYVRGNIETVKRAIEVAAGSCHVEVTTLVIPGKNDALEEMDAQAKWIAGIDKNIPLHISRFFPRYKIQDIPPTSAESMKRLADAASKHLRYVYLGNV